MRTLEQHREGYRIWRINNREHHLETRKKWRLKNKVKIKMWSKKYNLENKIKIMESAKTLRTTRRYKMTWYAIRSRCLTPNDNGYKYYGGRGIKCLITAEQVKFLWERDKAHLLKQPSIDRIDPNGHYELSNCRFIELSENARRAIIARNRLKGISRI